MKLTILNYNTVKVYQLTSIPSQEYIDKAHEGDWEDWLIESIDVWRSSECYYMIHEDEEVEMIECPITLQGRTE